MAQNPIIDNNQSFTKGMIRPLWPYIGQR